MPGDASRKNGEKGGRPPKQRAPASTDLTPAPEPVAPSGDRGFELTPNPFGLTHGEERFIAEYLVDGNAARAYRAVHPRCSEATSQTNGPEVLRKTHVTAAVAEARRQQWVRLQMDGDEALALLANIARGDIGHFLPDSDPLNALPADVRRCIKSVRPTKHGRVVELYDAPAAAVSILKAIGRFAPEKIQVNVDLEMIMARANTLAREQQLEAGA